MFSNFKIKAFAGLILLCFAAVTFSNTPAFPRPKSQEVSEIDGEPVLIKHLPGWGTRNDVSGATFATNRDELRNSALGDRPILDQIDFTAGTEAVTASYPEGKLLIVEYTSPQASIEADEKFKATLSGDETTVYRRIGNYNVLVFEAPDLAAANALIDQVKYEKQIQWLGDNPFRISAERAFILTTSDLFLSTVFVILIGIGLAIGGGLVVGYVYYLLSEKRRAAMTAFTDAGGMTRLNLDGFSADIATERLLGK